MATELYDILVPQLLRALNNLSAILDKAEAYAREQEITTEDLLGSRLVADMDPLTSQIQRASDSAKGSLVRLGGIENVVMPDEETTLFELQQRIAATIDFIKSVPREKIDGKEQAEVVLTFPNGEFRFTGIQFVTAFVLPNFYFHVTTAYALLRMRGVPIGKLDFLGGI